MASDDSLKLELEDTPRRLTPQQLMELSLQYARRLTPQQRMELSLQSAEANLRGLQFALRGVDYTKPSPEQVARIVHEIEALHANMESILKAQQEEKIGLLPAQDLP